MALTNTLKKQVDLPVWEQLRFAPAVSAAVTSACSADNSLFSEENGRYIYYLIAAASFWRYDTWTDTYQQLASPGITPVTWSSMKFSGGYGHEGSALAGGASSITIPAYYGNSLNGYDIRIIKGTGAGQQRVITNVAEPVSVASGTVSAAATGNIRSITDSTKSWTINQFVGYQVRITMGTGVGQVRRILYNDATTLYLGDINRAAVDYNAIPAELTPAVSAATGTQSAYSIESSVVTVDTAWDTPPDETSVFRILSGGILLLSSASAAPFYTLQYYDIATDLWYVRSATGSLVTSAASEASIERTTENASVWSKGKATSGTTTTLTDSTKAWRTNEHAGRWVRIYSGGGKNQIAQITSNTATVLTLATTLGTAVDSTSYYMIDGFDAGTATAGATSSITDSTKTWTVDQWKNYAVRIVAGTGAGQVLPVLSNTSTALTLYKPWGTTPDSTSQYVIQGDKDNAYLTLQGNAQLILHSVEANMACLGRIYDDGCARIGSAQYGSLPPVPITSIAGASTTKTVTTTIPHGFKTGWVITHRGDTGASAVQNNISAAITVVSSTTYTYTAAGSSAAGTFTALTATTLKDASKNWTVNEHANKVCYFTTAVPVAASGLATMVAMEIASNTADTLTFKTAPTTAPTNGVSRYVICERRSLGGEESGIATGTQSTTTLQDTSKAWATNQWAGYRVKFLSGTGQALEIAINSNTSNTLTFAATTSPVAASTSYTILGRLASNVGTNLNWAFGDATNKGKHLYCLRGNGLIGIDRYDLTTDRWVMLATTPSTEVLTTGSMTAYDGENRLYFTRDNTLRFYYYDIAANKVFTAGMAPYISGTQIVGNRLEIFETADRLKYIWFNRHSAQDCFRQLLFY